MDVNIANPAVAHKKLTLVEWTKLTFCAYKINSLHSKYWTLWFFVRVKN